VRSEVILYLYIWYFLCTFLQSNRRFTFNWTPMFRGDLIPKHHKHIHATLLTAYTGAVPVSIPPPQTHFTPLRHVVWTMDIDVSKAHIYPVFSAIKCLMMEATALHTYQTTRRQFQITPFIYTESLQLGPPVDHTNPRKLTVTHLVLPVQHRH